LLQSKQGQDFRCDGYAPPDLPEYFVERLDPDPGVGVFLGWFLGENAVAERQQEAAAVHGQHHFLQAVGIAVRGRAGRLRAVLGHVAGGFVGVLDQTDVDDVGVARGYVPLTAEVDLLYPTGVAEYVEVWVPVCGGYAPFDFNRRNATRDAATPPASPPEAPERSVKAIQSNGERLRISGKGECDEASWEIAEPISDASCGGG
jgi:hypothetical protein